MSDLALYFNKLSYTQCRKAMFPKAEDMKEEYSKIDSEAFQNCLVRFHDSYKVVAEQLVDQSNWNSNKVAE